ncbi:LysR family transcriptional regulator (plasmid) [Paraburkholderia sp. PREW-6R]|uniref:LysR family transcriptional regulator n=1 Tax=Paraburkholderia sp. PREW-6R TaxID=3141544 RepID=UPI0031F4BFDF
MAYYSAVVDAGSFTAAAERLGITKAVVSQQVAKLEQEVGTTLLVRTSRAVHPTEAGLAFHARCAAILKESEDAFNELAESSAVPTGALRVTAPSDYGTLVVVFALTEFTRRYPACEATLILSDKHMDIVSDQIDVAVRLGRLPDSGLQSRRIASTRQLLVCGSTLANIASAIKEPEDIQKLPFIAHAARRDPLRLNFSRGETEQRFIQATSTLAIDSTPAVHAAVLAGAGLSVLPDFVIAADLAAGRLVHVLPGWSLPGGDVHAVFPAARFRSAKVRAFVHLLNKAEELRQSRMPAASHHPLTMAYAETPAAFK